LTRLPRRALSGFPRPEATGSRGWSLLGITWFSSRRRRARREGGLAFGRPALDELVSNKPEFVWIGFQKDPPPQRGKETHAHTHTHTQILLARHNRKQAACDGGSLSAAAAILPYVQYLRRRRAVESKTDQLRSDASSVVVRSACARSSKGLPYSLLRILSFSLLGSRIRQTASR